MVIPKPEKIDIEFTDAKLTGIAGSLFIARLANQLKLPETLEEQINLKKRSRGCDDKDSLLGLIGSGSKLLIMYNVSYDLLSKSAMSWLQNGRYQPVWENQSGYPAISV